MSEWVTYLWMRQLGGGGWIDTLPGCGGGGWGGGEEAVEEVFGALHFSFFFFFGDVCEFFVCVCVWMCL